MPRYDAYRFGEHPKQKVGLWQKYFLSLRWKRKIRTCIVTLIFLDICQSTELMALPYLESIIRLSHITVPVNFMKGKLFQMKTSLSSITNLSISPRGRKLPVSIYEFVATVLSEYALSNLKVDSNDSAFHSIRNNPNIVEAGNAILSTIQNRAKKGKPIHANRATGEKIRVTTYNSKFTNLVNEINILLASGKSADEGLKRYTLRRLLIPITTTKRQIVVQTLFLTLIGIIMVTIDGRNWMEMDNRI